MRVKELVIGCISALCFITPAAMAQESSKPPVETPLRITVVFSEFDGNKKLSNLPYVIPCQTPMHGHESHLKIGFRVPYKVGHDEIQFEDVGTHLDCSAAPQNESGGFMMQLNVAHSTVYSVAQSSSGPEPWHPGTPLADDPIFGEIRAELKGLVLHDGQTIEALSATESVSGHLWKVDVTLNVVK